MALVPERKVYETPLPAGNAAPRNNPVARVQRELATKRNGRPPHVVTPTQQRLVQHWVAAGLSQGRIATMMGIAPDTLQKYYRYELDHGEDIANANVAANLYRIATGRSPGAAGAAQYWLNRRSEKFREHAKRVELTGKDGRPIAVDAGETTLDPRRLTADERETLRALLMKASTGDAIDAEFTDDDDNEESDDGNDGPDDTEITTDGESDEAEDDGDDGDDVEEGLPYPQHTAYDPSDPSAGFD